MLRGLNVGPSMLRSTAVVIAAVTEFQQSPGFDTLDRIEAHVADLRQDYCQDVERQARQAGHEKGARAERDVMLMGANRADGALERREPRTRYSEASIAGVAHMNAARDKTLAMLRHIAIGLPEGPARGQMLELIDALGPVPTPGMADNGAGQRVG